MTVSADRKGTPRGRISGRGEILAACRNGALSLHAVKTWTRAGMGRCQGRMCRMSVTACVAGATGRPVERLGYNRPRVPTRPVPIDQMLAVMEDDSAQSLIALEPF